MTEIIQTGALLDTRIDEEKAKDFLHEEVASGDATPVIWEEKVEFKEYFPYDQAQSLSCVSGGAAITEEHFARLEGAPYLPSRKDIYIRRINYPQGGMMLHDVFNIAIKGIASEMDVSSQGLGETPMNTIYPITQSILSNRSKHHFKAWVAIQNFRDIDTLARIVDHTPIVCFWFFDGNNSVQEHWRQFPQVIDKNLDVYAVKSAHHQVALVDRTLIDGKKYFVGQDTAGVGTGAGKNKNLRFYSEEFIKTRMYAAGYGINEFAPVDTSKPKVKLTKNLTVGDRGEDVSKLQSVLIYEKLLFIPAWVSPDNKPTGVFAGLTLRAVKDYQKKYASEILTPLGLKLPTGYVGSSTIKHINKNYE